MLEKETQISMAKLSPLIREAIILGADVKIRVTGNSMYPLLRDRVDEIVLTKVKKLHILDVPLYIRDNGSYVLHRIIKKGRDGYYMAGDNETKLEYPVKETQVIAVLRGLYRNGKYISCDTFFYRVYSFIWALLLPVRHKVLPFLLWVRRKMK